jgi:hypothetical protein
MTILIALLALSAFPVIWGGTVWIISRLGWATLAAHFETDQPPTGHTLRFQSARIGISNYNGVLTVHIEPDGLRLAVIAPFRFGHPPLLIPWDAITAIRPQKVLWMTVYAIDIGEPHVQTVQVSARIIDAIRDHAPSPA